MSRIAREEPTVIYCNQIADTPVGALLKCSHRVNRLVCHLRLPPPETRQLNQIGLSARKADRFIVANLNMKEAWSNWGIEAKRISIVPNAFVIDDYQALSYEGPKNDILRIGYLGRIAESEGVHVAIESVAKLNQSGHRCHLYIGGKPFPEGESVYLERLNRLIREFNIADCVTFLGHVGERTSFFEKIDVLLFPSLWNEPFGRVLVESILSNRPVIANDVGSVREILSEGAKSWIYSTTDELERTLRQFPSSWKEYPLDAMRESMVRRFDIREIVAQLSSILTQCD